jgi:hypothetical protein
MKNVETMNLTAPPRRGRVTAARSNSPTTTPGHINPNRQTVIARTGAPSRTRPSQTVYHLRWALCQHNYGCNGLDIKDRLCPRCQSGTPGEPLRKPSPTPFVTFALKTPRHHPPNIS